MFSGSSSKMLTLPILPGILQTPLGSPSLIFLRDLISKQQQKSIVISVKNHSQINLTTSHLTPFYKIKSCLVFLLQRCGYQLVQLKQALVFPAFTPLFPTTAKLSTTTPPRLAVRAGSYPGTRLAPLLRSRNSSPGDGSAVLTYSELQNIHKR